VNFAPKSIVLVEDEPSYAELISQLLSRSFDCPVHVFSNPIDAIPALGNLNPAVIVTDYHMPQLSGVEFIKAASLKVPDAAFLLMSGEDIDEEEPGLSTLAPLKGQLTKPFSWRALADEIVRVWPKDSPLPGRRVAATP
jgi:CheY-like chemotaxis protein